MEEAFTGEAKIYFMSLPLNRLSIKTKRKKKFLSFSFRFAAEAYKFQYISQSVSFLWSIFSAIFTTGVDDMNERVREREREKRRQVVVVSFSPLLLAAVALPFLPSFVRFIYIVVNKFSSLPTFMR